MKTGARPFFLAAYAAPASENYSSDLFAAAVSHFLSGEYNPALGILKSLLLNISEERVEHFEVLRLLTFCSQSNGDLVGAEDFARRIQELAELHGVPTWKGHALVHLCAISREKGHAGYGEDLSARAKAILRECGDLIGLARACYEHGYCLLQQGKLSAARRELETATTLASVSSDPMTEGLASHRLGFCLVQQSEFAQARVVYERALQTFLGIGSESHAARVAYGLAVLEMCLGDLVAARVRILSWNRVYERFTDALRVSRWNLLKGLLLVLEGEPREALETLTKAKDAFEELGAQRDVALCWEYVGDAQGLLGEDEAALSAYTASIDWGRRVSVAADVVVESLRKSGEALMRLGKIRDATAFARSATRLTRLYNEPLERACLMRLRGVLKVLRGRSNRGLALIESAWEVFTRIEARIEAQTTARVLHHFCEQSGRSEEATSWKRRSGGESVGALLLVPRSGAQAEPRRSTRKRDESVVRSAQDHGIVSRDARVLRAFETTLRASSLELPLLILGETGSGKELFANLAHTESGRKGTLLVINCAALPADILDAELFGHAKGAYTGADRDRPGLIEAASGGTLFLDEIGEMSLAVQGRLLRAIEAREVRRLGENHPRKVSTRFIGATHRDLNQMVRDGSFRADLFFRLRGIIVNLPPLRERPDDILLLADHFLAREASRTGRELRLTSGAREKMNSHLWPGNVRELKSVIERAAALCESGDSITAEDLGIDWVQNSGSLAEHLESEERRRLLAILESVDWNQTKAARQMKIKRTTLVGKLARLGIERPRKK